MYYIFNMSLAEKVLRNKFVTQSIKQYNLGLGRDRKFSNLVCSFLKPESKIIDIGCGVGRIAKLLKSEGHHVTPIDIQNLSIYQEIAPIIYDGENIPFKKNSFDWALILTVLHHAKKPEKIIQEAKRVARNIIIIEDVYKNKTGKFVVQVLDTLYNLEIFHHPYNHKDDEGWRKIFGDNKLKVNKTIDFRTWGMPEKLYHLTK